MDQYSRECPILESGVSLSSIAVVASLKKVAKERSLSVSITVDNGSEFAGRALNTRAYLNKVKLDLIRPGKPVEKCSIDSFNGKLRDVCMKKEVYLSIAVVREKLEQWRYDYNLLSRSSSLSYRPPADSASELLGN